MLASMLFDHHHHHQFVFQLSVHIFTLSLNGGGQLVQSLHGAEKVTIKGYFILTVI